MTKPSYEEPKYSDLETHLAKEVERLNESLARVRGLLQRQWVSVEERLPEKWQRVLTWVYVSHDHLGHFIAWLNSRGEWCDALGDYKSDAITHWQPLPDVPNFPQSSSLVPEGAESADIGKLDAADKSGKVNRVDEKADEILKDLMQELGYVLDMGGGLSLPIQIQMKKASAYLDSLVPRLGSAETGGGKADDELKELRDLPDDKIDTSDIPEVTDWSKAERGKFYKPARPGVERA